MNKRIFLVALGIQAMALTESFADEPISEVKVTAQRDPQWAAYSKAYRVLKDIDGFTGEHDLARVYFWLQPKTPGVDMQNLRLRLLGERTNLELPVDRLGRTLVPIDEIAAREGAEFVINRPAGTFNFANVVEIKPLADGFYSVDYLKTACEQARQVFVFGNRWRLASWRARGMKCAGVKFQSVKDPSAAPELYFLDDSGGERLLPTKNAVSYIVFADWPQSGKVRAVDPALSITIGIQ